LINRVNISLKVSVDSDDICTFETYLQWHSLVGRNLGRRSVAGRLFLPCGRSMVDIWPPLLINCLLWVSQPC